MEILLKIIGIIISFGMLYNAYFVSRIAGSWLLPSCIYSIAWFLFTIIPMIILPQVPVNPLAVGYVLLTCIAFSLPVLGVRWQVVKPIVNIDASKQFDRPFLRWAFYSFAVLTFVALTLNAQEQGISLSLLFSNFFVISNSLIADRYNQTTIATVFDQISNVASYITVCLGGLIFPGYKSKISRTIVIIFAMAPSLIVMTVFGAKGMIFLCIALFYAGTLVRRQRFGDYRLIERSTIAKAALIICVLIPFVAISFLARGLYEDQSQSRLMDGLFRYSVSYSTAHLYAFSDWFSWYIGMSSDQIYLSEQPTGGFYTFMSIFRALGYNKVAPPGVYTEYYQYSWYLQTNIYTIFRGLITDYTLPGSLIVLSVFGFICNQVYVKMTQSFSASWSVSFYMIFVGFVYTSFIISLFIWNSMYPVFVIVSLILMINNEGASSERRRRAITNGELAPFRTQAQ